MKLLDKSLWLAANHYEEWKKAHKEADDEVSKDCSMFCICGRLCTGLHERTCRRFRTKVDSVAVKKLKHLLPTREAKK